MQAKSGKDPSSVKSPASRSLVFSLVFIKLLFIMETIIVRYGEIALKGKNRKDFEKKLAENIIRSANPDFFRFYSLPRGKIIFKLTKKGEKNGKIIEEALRKVPGIVNFSFAKEIPTDLEVTKTEIEKILKTKKFNSFKIEAKRENKNFPLTSPQISKEVGAYVVEKTNKKVDLEKPDIIGFVEVGEKSAFICAEKIKGIGGLPTSSGGRAVALLSDGIDSPVAFFLMAKRGLAIIPIHFLVNKEEKSVIEIAKTLKPYQGEIKLYLAPFQKTQEEIVASVRPSKRCLICKSVMLKTAEILANKKAGKAIITGDNLGQVASQTLDNINFINSGIKLPIFRPLVGSNKEEIVSIAKQIGTLQKQGGENSVCPIVPKNPITRTKETAKIKDTEMVKKLADKTMEKIKKIIV